MNFLKLHTSAEIIALVNMDLVTEMHSAKTGKCTLYFNTMASDVEQAYIQVEESIDEIVAMLSANN